MGRSNRGQYGNVLRPLKVKTDAMDLTVNSKEKYGHNRSFLGPGLSPTQESSWDMPKPGMSSAYYQMKYHHLEKFRQEQEQAKKGPKFLRDTMDVNDIKNGSNMGEWGQNSVAREADGSPKRFNNLGIKSFMGKSGSHSRRFMAMKQ